MKKSSKQKDSSFEIDLKKFCTLSDINKQMIRFCKIMSDPTRFKIVSLLRNGAMPVQDIADILKKTDSNVSHQLRLLKLHGVVKAKQKAKFRIYDLTSQFKEKLSSFINQY